MTIDLPLMQNNITRDDLDRVIDFLSGPDLPILTQSRQVQAFEQAWSDWLGVRHSLFVNSGSSANHITMAVLRERFGVGEVIVPCVTWVSDIASVLGAGHTPVFVDIDLPTLSMNVDQILACITSRTRAVFLTHVLGFSGLSERLLQELQARDIPLIEDTCESHGATHRGQKVGSFGLASNFSFYYAHHLSTVEGGMVCTNDSEFYQLARMFRSHGMVREATDADLRRRWQAAHPDLNPDFIFAFAAHNFRNTEINAVMGLSQLPRLDANNEKRRANFQMFLEGLDPKRFFTEFKVEGSCNYAFTLVLREPDQDLCQRLMQAMREARVEFRRGTAGGGNQTRQPYLHGILPERHHLQFPVAEHVHFFGFYIGNYPDLEPGRIRQLCDLLNQVQWHG